MVLLREQLTGRGWGTRLAWLVVVDSPRRLLGPLSRNQGGQPGTSQRPKDAYCEVSRRVRSWDFEAQLSALCPSGT